MQLDNEYTPRVSVIGLGHTGLPMAIAYANAGYEVIAYDTSETVIDDLRHGHADIPGVSHNDLLNENLSFTSYPDDMEGSDTYIVCVPTPATSRRTANLQYVGKAFHDIAGVIVDGAVVILQSTVPIGTTRKFASKIHADVTIGFSPERINPGSIEWAGVDTPRLVAALDEDRLHIACQALEVVVSCLVPVESVEVAEAAKLWENTYRAVNIAAAQELQEIAHHYGLNVREIVNAAGSKPYGFGRFYPGAGVGGDCIPTDPWFLIQEAESTPVIWSALTANRDRPRNIAAAARDILGSDLSASILVLGASYKPGVADTRNSPGIQIMKHLASFGLYVDYCDPLVTEVYVGSRYLDRVNWENVTGNEYDMIIVATADPDWFMNPNVWEGSATILDPWDLVQVKTDKTIHSVT